MLQSTTIFAETATVVGGAHTTINKTIDVKKDKDGNPESAKINKKKAVTSTIISSASITGLNSFQNWSFDQTMSAEAIENVYNAQAYIESLSNDELQELDALLQQKELALMAEEASKEAVQKVKTL